MRDSVIGMSSDGRQSRGRPRWGRAITALVTAAALTMVVPPAAAEHACSEFNPFTTELQATLAEQFPGKRFTAEVFDTRTDCTYTLNPDLRITTASVIKIEVMAGILLRAQQQNRELTTWEKDRIGPMIRQSADPETSALWLSLGGASGMEDLDRTFGLVDTVHVSPGWGATVTSARDQVTMVRRALVDGDSPLNSASQAIAAEYMTTVTESQQWGISAGVPDDWTVALKNGFYPLSGIGWRINSVGFVNDPTGGGYAVAILTDGWSTEGAGIEANELVAAAIASHLAIEGLDTVYEGTFRDDDHSVFQADIETIAGLEVTNGCNPPDNDRYCPDQPVTRGQMAAFLTRMLDLDVGSLDPFNDDDTSVFEADINAIHAAGITFGCNPPDNDRYCPDNPITRGQMAAFLVRAFNVDHSARDAFLDDNDTIFEPDINALAAAGITLGCNPPDNDRYCPDDLVTRGQMAAFLARVARL